MASKPQKLGKNFDAKIIKNPLLMLDGETWARFDSNVAKIETCGKLVDEGNELFFDFLMIFHWNFVEFYKI